MCLHTVDKKTKKLTEGWKVFRTTRDGKLRPNVMMQAVPGSSYYSTNEWMQDKSKAMIGIDPTYETGFHFYQKYSDAEMNTINKCHIRNVKVKNVVATGTQDGYAVGVAKKIFIDE